MKNTGQLISLEKLNESGASSGLASRKWNPAMKPFIKGKRGHMHIIDTEKTAEILAGAYNFIYDLTEKGGKILLVGTKLKSVNEQVKEQAKRAQFHFINQRWLGGTLTNFSTINKSIYRLNDLVTLDKSGEIQKFTKKEQIKIQKEIDKLIKFVGGITMMRKLPDALIVLDPKSEINAVREAKKLKIPTIGLSNTNGDPTLTDITIPINTNSNRAITLVLQLMADAACEARGESPLVARKPDSEIQLVEEKRASTFHVSRTSHRTFNKFAKPGMRPTGPRKESAPTTPKPAPTE